MKSMARVRKVGWALLVFGMSVCAAAQNSPQSQPETAPAPAFGQNAPVLNPENPPVSGLDVPSLELRTATRSFISPGLLVSESADTNGNNQLGNSSGLESITRVLGALDLQQFWPKSDLFLEYLGGGAFYGNPFHAEQLQAVGLEAVTRWRTGQVTVRDAFSYLPDGAFVMGFGGVPGFGFANGGFATGMQGGGLPGLNSFGGALGSVGNIPRLANTAILDVVQAISPTSAITVAGGFSNTHFYDPTNTLINSDEVTVEAGYSHLLNRHDQIGVIYAFQLFQFPQETGGEIYSQIVNVRWSHTITGRLSLVVGAGPQYTELEEGGSYTRWSLSARAQLRYKFRRASLIASYEKYTSSGEGLFAGANTQVAALGYTRPLGRVWQFFSDVSYSHSTQLQNVAVGGAHAGSYNNTSAGVILRRHWGRSYDFFGSYSFGELAFNVPVSIGGSTGRTSQRQTGAIGVEWHPKPTRIE